MSTKYNKIYKVHSTKAIKYVQVEDLFLLFVLLFYKIVKTGH